MESTPRFGLTSRPAGPRPLGMKRVSMRSGTLRALAAALGLAASPASALDCDKAASPSEIAICADPAARAADSAMADAFAALLAGAAPSAKPAIVAAQAHWLRDRDFACEPENGPKLAACLAEQSGRRRAFLAAEPEAGPGAPGRLAPWFRYEAGAPGKAAVMVQLLRYPSPATPAERAFDSAVDKLAGGIDEPEKGDPAADHYEYDRSMRVTYASPRLISAHIDGFNDTGGAHPNTFSGDVTIDVEQGREATFADLLDEAGAKAVFAYCLKSVIAAKTARMGADAPLSAADLKELAKNVAAETGKLTTWSFSADKATVTYDPYAVGAYVEGAYRCEIPYSALKPLAKPSFPLP